MDGKNENQEQEPQNQDLTPPEPKRLRQVDGPDDEPKQHGPKRRIRTYKTTQTRRPITKTTPTGKFKSFLSFKRGNIPRYT